MIKSSAIYRNTRNLDADLSLMDTAMECAYFMEQIGAMAFINWDKGELIGGPYVERFFTTIKLMFSIKLLPDITVIERLRKMDCKVSYETEVYRQTVTQRIGDYGANMETKVVDHKVWIVTIKIPNRYLDLDGNTVMTIDGREVRYDDIDVTYTNGAEESLTDGDGGDMGNDGGGDFDMGDDMEF